MTHPLTIDFGERTLAIYTDAKVSKAYDAVRTPNVPHPQYMMCKAIWDTGAVNSVITPKIVSELGLVSLGKVKMHHANGDSLVDTYMINLLLPNQMEVHTLSILIFCIVLIISIERSLASLNVPKCFQWICKWETS